MLLPDLRDEAKAVLLNPAVTDEALAAYANDALRSVASRVFLPDLEAAAVVVVPSGKSDVLLPGDFQRHLFAATSAEGRRLCIVTKALDVQRLDMARFSPGRVNYVFQGAGRLRVWPAPAEDETVLLGYFRLPRTVWQAAASVAFSAASSELAADGPVFARFHAGDVFTVSGSASNDREFTVVSRRDAVCTVAEAVADEGEKAVNLAALGIEGVPEHLHRDVVLPGVLWRAFDRAEDAYEGKKNALHYKALFDAGVRDLKRDIVASGWKPQGLPGETAGRGTLA